MTAFNGTRSLAGKARLINQCREVSHYIALGIVCETKVFENECASFFAIFFNTSNSLSSLLFLTGERACAMSSAINIYHP